MNTIFLIRIFFFAGGVLKRIFRSVKLISRLCQEHVTCPVL
jgi:hypothetical protein